jgi:putative sterol carrier protein
MAEIFTAEWARDWCRAVHDSDAYRRAAVGWEGSIVVEMSADPKMGVAAPRAVFLDLHDGDCRDGRPAGDAERDAALFVLRATPAVWRRVLRREVEPIWGLMSGKIELAKGSIAKLVPYTRAAKELVEAAAALPATFPDGWSSPETP